MALLSSGSKTIPKKIPDIILRVVNFEGLSLRQAKTSQDSCPRADPSTGKGHYFSCETIAKRTSKERNLALDNGILLVQKPGTSEYGFVQTYKL